MSESHDHDHDHDDHGGHGGHGGMGHVAPLRALIGTGLALLVLTWLTVSASMIDLGEGNIYIALGIAVVKGSLVALFFMHLVWDRAFNAIIFVGSLCFVGLFLALAMTDTSAYQEDLIAGDAPAVVEAIAAQE